MLKRMIGAALLRTSVYEEVEHDTNATLQAALVVVVVSIATAFGGYLTFGGNIIWALASGIILGVVQWAVWAFITYVVGTKIFNTENTHADWGQMARGTAFAQTPGVLLVFSFLPGVGPIIGMLAGIWKLVAMTVGVKQVLDYDSIWRAVGVVIVGLLVVLVPLFIIVMMVGVPTQ